MKRIDCEKCLNSEFYGTDRIRCRLKKCQPEYADMKEVVEALLKAFPGSFINHNKEFIAHEKSNTYFILKDCEYPEDVECKILEWLSRSAYKGMPYNQEWRNERFRKLILRGINEFLETDFSTKEIEKIYTYLGNAVNHEKTIQFIHSNYDFSVLEKK